MSGLSLAITRLERVGDIFNAILVKEARQALKSRQFAGTFLLLLLVCWTGSLFGVVLQGESIEYGSSAEVFFGGFFFVLSMASLVIVPFSAFRSIVEERSENTLELVQITTLSPRQIVRGKVATAMMQVLVYYSAIAPFIAFTSLLPGFDLPQVAFALIALLIASLCFTTVALAIGAQSRTKASQAFSTLFVVGASVAGAFSLSTSLITASGEIRFDEPDFWWGLSAVLFLALSTAYLCLQIAVAQVTFESDNRSSGIRLTVVVQWLGIWLGMIGVFWIRKFGSMQLGLLEFLMTVTAIYITATSLYFACESDLLSRRVSRSIPRSQLLRYLWIPFLPGGARGFLYGLCSLGVLGVIIESFYSLVTTTSFSTSDFWAYAGGLLCYLVIYMGVGTFFARFLRRTMKSVVAAHIFILLALITTVLTAMSVGAQFYFDLQGTTRKIVNLANPVSTLQMIETGRNGGIGFSYVLLILGAVLAVLVNLRAIRRVVAEVLNHPVRAKQQQHAAVSVPVSNDVIPTGMQTLAGSDAVSP